VSNLRLQIDQPKEHAEYGGDPGADGSTHGGAQGYAAHYCNIPTRVDPKIVACSFIASGLRLFDISDLAHPKEVGYFVAPTQAKFENGGEASDFAMSEPAFVPARHEVWFTDGTSGFYALKVTNGAWPGATTSAVRGTCTAAKRKTYTLKLPRGTKARRVRASLGKKRVRVTHLKRDRGKVRVTVNARGLKRGKLRFRVRLTNHKMVKRSRTFKGCAAH